MSMKRWSGKSRGALRGAAGYSLVEMIVAIGMASIVGMGLWALYNSQQRSASSQKLYAELQTGCNLAMDQMKQELLLAGYRAEDSTAVKTFSAVNHKTGDATNRIFDQITFEYFDDKAKFNDVSPSEPNYDPTIPWSQAANYTELTKVRYALSGGTLSRNVARFNPSGYSGEVAQVLADNIQNLEFELFRDDNTQMTNPVSGSAFDQIRNVRIKLVCQSPKTDTLTGRTPVITLTASVKPRNVGLEANPRDTSPPAIPTNVKAWDPGVCSSLQLRWDANTEADLGGYTVYYGLEPGVYSGRARISRAPQAGGNYEYLTLSGLTPTKATDLGPTTYYIVVSSYDKASNQSDYSTPEISGNPSPSTPTEGALGGSGIDTTINIPAAPAPSGFAAAPGAEGQINLSWPTAATPGLSGYRLYRGTSSTFVPDDTPGTGNLLAGQGVLNETKTSWVDTGADQPGGHLKGCTPYYYKLAAIHCDPTIPTASLNFADATAMPTDTTPPPTPVLTARPGFRRIILTLKNPAEAVAPDFKETKIWYNEGVAGVPNHPLINEDGTNANGTLIPDSYPYNPAAPGTFTRFSSQPAINFNSMTHGNPAYTNPELTANATYFFTAVAYDWCGRHSEVTGEAQAEGSQCNDCVAPELCFDAPPPPYNLRAAGCSGPLTVSWDYPYLDQTEDYRDLTGFHVFRREGPSWVGGTNEVELTSYDGDPAHGDPIWLTSFEDAAALEGKIYSYRVQATDCYYERRNSSPPWPLPGDDPANLPTDNFAESFLGDLYIGRFTRDYIDVPVIAVLTSAIGPSDTTINVLSTTGFVGGGNKILIDGELITFSGITATSFTGCVRGAEGSTAASHGIGDRAYKAPFPPPLSVLTGGLYLTPPQMHHNIVALAMKNTAAGTLTLNQLSTSWENTSSYLQSLVVGDGNTTPETTGLSDSPPLTKAYTGGTTTLAPVAPLSPLDTGIPLALVFRNQNGTVTAETNMREDLLSIGPSWLNGVPARQCPDPPAAPALVPIPLGPVVSGVTMDKPSAGTLAIPVPGAGAAANPMNVVVVPGGTRVNVFADVFDTSLAGIRSVGLYYHVDGGRALTAAPPLDGSASFPVLPPYTRIALSYVAGNQWRTPAGLGIPISDNTNVWFFIVAVDNQGNFDREPELDGGAFEYYQQQFDVCQNTPNPPGISGSSSAAGVALTLTKPTLNAEDGSPCTDFAGYKIYRKLGNGAYSLLTSVATTSSPYAFADVPPNIGTPGNDYTYYATAFDSCVPAKVSAPSSTYSECEGAPPCTVTITPSRAPSFFAGDTFTVDLTTCPPQNGVSGENVWIQTCSSADSDPVQLLESGDTGAFRIDSAAYGGAATVNTYLNGAVAPDPRAYPGSPTDLDLRVAATDTITVGAYSGTLPPASWDSSCQSATLQCSTTLAVSVDPCATPATPSAPQNLVAVGTSCTANGADVDLSWSAPATGPVSFYRVYRCNAAVDGAGCTPTALYADNISGTTFSDTAPGGKLNSNSIKLWYTVKAVNNACATDVKVGDGAAKVSDGCGSN